MMPTTRLARGLKVAVAVLVASFMVLTVAAPAAADSIRDQQYWLADYGFIDAWRFSQGEGVTVAVIDTGVDGSVKDLAGAVVGGTDVSGIGTPDGEKPLGENSDHGTLVASMLAGRGTGPGHGSGIIGVAPKASILAISVAFGEAAEDINSDDQIASAVRWAVDNGADVINMSLTRNSLQWPESWDDAFLYAFDNDVVVVAAAGNRAGGTTEVGAPATIPGVLTVAGVDRNREASFDASSQGMTIAVSAPSEDLVAAAPGDRYFTWGGTSGAAPLVSGLVALVRAEYPELDAANVINRVVSTATQVGDSEHSPIYGFGLINAYAAVADYVEEISENPMGDLSEWIRLYRRAETAPEPDPEPQEESIPATILPPPPPDQYHADSWPDTRANIISNGIPLVMAFGFASLVLLGAIGASRHFKRAARRQ